MRTIFYIIIFVLTVSCGTTNSKQELPKKDITSVKFEEIFNETVSIRAIAITEDKNLVYGGNKTVVGYYNPKTKQHTQLLKGKVSDTLDVSFRAIAVANDNVFAISIGNPALLYKITPDGNVSLVYTEKNEKVFYDSITFWNAQEGIAMGDPTENCISIIVTRDGGNTWRKVPCSKLPKAMEGEAAFAASDTNVAVIGSQTWIATGGKSSRILYSLDKGSTWQVFNTPIIQGLPTTGMYSIDFYDTKHGFAIGGDYTKPEATTANKIRTIDGGKTWEIVADGSAPGYRSCVQYIPNSHAKELIAVGFKGIDYSNDGGLNWQHLSDEGFYTIRFVNDTIAYAAGKDRIAKLIFIRN